MGGRGLGVAGQGRHTPPERDTGASPKRGGPWSLKVTPAMCLLASPILREPDRCWRKAGAEEVEGARVALRVCFGEGVFRPPMSSCLKQMQSPFTLL